MTDERPQVDLIVSTTALQEDLPKEFLQALRVAGLTLPATPDQIEEDAVT